jgi:hypothetical protein
VIIGTGTRGSVRRPANWRLAKEIDNRKMNSLGEKRRKPERRRECLTLRIIDRILRTIMKGAAARQPAAARLA